MTRSWFDRPIHYVLDSDHTVVPMDDGDLLVWARWFENTDARRVKQTDVGPYWVSTVFLGLDHQFREGPPLVFETMVFARQPDEATSAGHDFDCRRYSTWDEAVAGHDLTVQLVQMSLEPVRSDEKATP